jgi:flagellar biosynthesis protein FlhB
MEKNKLQLSYYQRNKEKLKEYRNRPEIKERMKEYQKDYFQKRKNKNITKKDEIIREVKISQNVVVFF